jgi:hypothetical protein
VRLGGFEYRQTATQAGDIQEDGVRRTTWGDHPEPPSAPSEVVVKLDESAKPARADEAHVSEIHDHGASTLALRLPQRGAKIANAPDVEFSFRSDDSWFASGQCTEVGSGTGTVVSVFDAERRQASKVAEVHGAAVRGVEARTPQAPHPPDSRVADVRQSSPSSFARGANAGWRVAWRALLRRIDRRHRSFAMPSGHVRLSRPRSPKSSNSSASATIRRCSQCVVQPEVSRALLARLPV